MWVSFEIFRFQFFFGTCFGLQVECTLFCRPLSSKMVSFDIFPSCRWSPLVNTFTKLSSKAIPNFVRCVTPTPPSHHPSTPTLFSLSVSFSFPLSFSVRLSLCVRVCVCVSLSLSNTHTPHTGVYRRVVRTLPKAVGGRTGLIHLFRYE